MFGSGLGFGFGCQDTPPNPNPTHCHPYMRATMAAAHAGGCRGEGGGRRERAPEVVGERERREGAAQDGE